MEYAPHSMWTLIQVVLLSGAFLENNHLPGIPVGQICEPLKLPRVTNGRIRVNNNQTN